MIENFTWLVLCIYFEARNQPLEAKVTVGHVIMNRMIQSNSSIKDVVTKPYQFSWMNTDVAPSIDDYQAYIDCETAAIEVLNQRMDGKDFFGADHYYDDSIEPPYWTKSMKFIAKVGAFYVYKS